MTADNEIFLKNDGYLNFFIQNDGYSVFFKWRLTSKKWFFISSQIKLKYFVRSLLRVFLNHKNNHIIVHCWGKNSWIIFNIASTCICTTIVASYLIWYYKTNKNWIYVNWSLKALSNIRSWLVINGMLFNPDMDKFDSF